jgi:uncharacterized RDD family membrane protein YckC
MNWFYVSAGQQAGPVDDAQLESLARTGQIQMDTLVWREGMAEWQPYSTVAGPGVQAATNPPVTSQIGAVNTPIAANEVVCAECGRIFPMDETIQFGTSRVCAGCKPIFMQKLAEGAKIGGEMRYASFMTRFGALFLDRLILSAVSFGISAIAGVAVFSSLGESSGKLGLQVVLMLINLCLAGVYEVLMVGKYGATLGKMAAKIRVVTADGGKVSYGRATGRYFAKLLSAFTCLIGFIMAAFDEEKRALHDRICNTRVISIS